MSATAIFRCDAAPEIGAGHVMRSLTLAERFSWSGWSCVFAVNAAAPDTVPALRESGHEIRIVDGMADIEPGGDSLVVIDHYGISGPAERKLNGNCGPLIVMDDLANRRHDCDILMDATPDRKQGDYRPLTPAGCRLLLGPAYAMVRREWRTRRAETTARLASGPKVERMLVSMGSTDPMNVSGQVLDALAISGLDCRIDVVLGASAPHRERIVARAGRNVSVHIDPPDLPALAAACDLAIGASGSSSFERAVLGLPSVTVVIADNQRKMSTAMERAGATIPVPLDIVLDAELFGRRIASLVAAGSQRAAMSKAAARVTDGRGAMRLLAALAGAMRTRRNSEIGFRLAEVEDEDWLFWLQGQPQMRRYYRNPAVPTASEHHAWMQSVLNDDNRILFVVLKDDKPVGTIRLDRLAGEAVRHEVSIEVEPQSHGCGIAVTALKLLRRVAPASELIAEIHQDNAASIALFRGAGYGQIEDRLFRSAPMRNR